MRPYVVLLACASIIASLLIAVGPLPVAAANPASGTLTDGQTLTYTGGPYVLPNDTNQLGAESIVCAPPALQCDDFALTVNASPAYAAANSVQIKIEWPNKTADFDLYVFDSKNELVTSSPTAADPEIAMMPTVNGTYTVRVLPFLPLGDTFTATISFNPKVAIPPRAEPIQAYHSFAAPSGQADGAGEPSIGSNWATDHAFFQSGSRTYRVSFANGTAKWEEKSARIPKCTVQTGFDPIGFVDHDTGRVFSSELLVNPVVNSVTCFSSDEGETWTPTSGGGLGQGVDHQTIGGGPYKAGVPGGPTTAYPNAVYYCSQHLVLANCSRSDDGGQLFSPAVTIYNGECTGIHGHVKVAPNGTVWVPNRSCGGRAGAAVSFTNGATWVIRQVPGSSGGDSDPSVGISTGNAVYLGYVGSDRHAYVAMSRDEGLTWSGHTDVGAIAGIENAVFPAVVAGDDDRAAFAFLGTTTKGDPGDANFAGVWQLYVAQTYDGGRTWSLATVDAPNDPVQRGCIWLHGGDDPCRNLLDFMGAEVDSHGIVHVGYADGCIDPDNDPSTADCVSGMNAGDATPGYRTEKGTIARQIAGKPLFSRFDPPQADLTVTDITATQAKPRSVTLTATVANIGTAAATGFLVRFADGATTLGDSGPVSVAAGGTAKVSFAWDRPSTGDHVVVVTADPTGVVPEKDETNNTAKRLITIKGNKVQNGSFEQSSNGTTADGWTGTSGTGRDGSGGNATDGVAAAYATAKTLGPTAIGQAVELISEVIPVEAGKTFSISTAVKTVDASSAPSVQVQLIGATGTVVNAVTALTSAVGGTSAAQQLVGSITIPAGITGVRIVLVGFAATDLARTGTVYFDDVWLWGP